MTAPQAPSAERGVLGASLLDSYLVMDLAARHGMTIEWFYVSAHRRIYGCMAYLRDQGKAGDALVVKTYLERKGILEEVGGMAYLLGMIDGALVPSIETYIDDMEQAWKGRVILKSLMQVEQAVYAGGDCSEIIADHLSEMHEVAQEKGEEDSKRAAWERVSNLALQAREGRARGVPSPWESFNGFTGGAPYNVYTLVIGKSKSRKSYLVHQWGLYAAVTQENPIPGSYYALEDGLDTALARAACALAGYDSWLFEHGRFTDEEKGRIDDCAERIVNSHYEIRDASGLSLAQLRLSIARDVSKNGHRFVIIDALKDMSGSDGDYKKEVALAKWLQQIAREFKIALIVVHHVNKGGSRSDRPERDIWWERITKADSRGASQLTDGARMILALQCQMHRKNGTLGGFVLDCIANNNGPTGNVSLDLDEGSGVFTESERDAFSDWVDQDGKPLMKSPPWMSQPTAQAIEFDPDTLDDVSGL
jgi:replicative DNA helicase